MHERVPVGRLLWNIQEQFVSHQQRSHAEMLEKSPLIRDFFKQAIILKWPVRVRCGRSALSLTINLNVNCIRNSWETVWMGPTAHNGCG